MSLLRSDRVWFAVKAVIAVAALVTILATRLYYPPIPPVDSKAAALIDRLVYVTDQGPGTRSTAWTSSFIAVDEDARFHGGILGSEKPVMNPAMRDLVRMGIAALPDLLNHLSDSRPTGLSVRQMRFGDGQGRIGFMAIWQSDEYDPRHHEAGRRPAGVNTRDRERSVDRYTLRVGDLCYVAIGQIVNRHLSALRYQPSMCLVINSPVQTPALADAVRKDWTGLTAEQHRQSLIEDALDDSWPYAAPAALQRLYFYYPDAADPIATKLLARPWYDSLKLRNFILGPLVEEQDSDGWKKRIAQFSTENGPAAADMIPHWLRSLNWKGFADQTKDFQKGEATAKKILADVYPQFELGQPGFVNGTTDRDQMHLIQGLSNVRSEKLDDAIIKVFQSLDLKRYTESDRIDADDVALACMDRLIGKGMDAEIRAYCEQRIRELEQKTRGYAEEQRLQALRERLGRIRIR